METQDLGLDAPAARHSGTAPSHTSKDGSERVAPDQAAQQPPAAERPPSLARWATSTAYAGYRSSPPAQRAAFWMLCSFATTIATSRAINYVRERCRPTPRTRGTARILTRLSPSNRIRVHHFLPGIGIGFTTGGTALLTNPRPVTPWLSVPFGAGLALTTDELPLLAGRNDPYWGAERLALAQFTAATIGAAGFATLFHRRGRHNAGRT